MKGCLWTDNKWIFKNVILFQHIPWKLNIFAKTAVSKTRKLKRPSTLVHVLLWKKKQERNVWQMYTFLLYLKCKKLYFYFKRIKQEKRERKFKKNLFLVFIFFLAKDGVSFYILWWVWNHDWRVCDKISYIPKCCLPVMNLNTTKRTKH